MPIISVLKPDEKVSADDPRLFNMADLAQVLGVDRQYIRRMKWSGFKMPGGRATVAAAHEFLAKVEDFAVSPRNRKKNLESKAVA